MGNDRRPPLHDFRPELASLFAPDVENPWKKGGSKARSRLRISHLRHPNRLLVSAIPAFHIRLPAPPSAERDRLPVLAVNARQMHGTSKQGSLTKMASQSTQLEETSRLWGEILGAVQGRLGSQQTFETWFKPIQPIRLG